MHLYTKYVCIMHTMDGYLTTTQAAQLANIGAEYVRLLARQGRIASQKFGHMLMIDKASLQAHVDRSNQWRADRATKHKATK